MFHFFKHRVHESVALSVFLAASMTMHIAWMGNWLVYRSAWVRQIMTVSSTIGPISGLYMKSIVSFFVLFGLFMLYFRGKDVLAWRERVVWFFLASILIFIVFTLPPVFEFSIYPDSVSQ